MGALEVVARPEFAKPELEWLMQLRQTKAHSSGPPAFTLVFPGAESGIDVVKHVEAICAATVRICFSLRSAMIVPEHKTGWYHVFLVPDEGFWRDHPPARSAPCRAAGMLPAPGHAVYPAFDRRQHRRIR